MFDDDCGLGLICLGISLLVDWFTAVSWFVVFGCFAVGLIECFMF